MFSKIHWKIEKLRWKFMLILAGLASPCFEQPGPALGHRVSHDFPRKTVEFSEWKVYGETRTKTKITPSKSPLLPLGLFTVALFSLIIKIAPCGSCNSSISSFWLKKIKQVSQTFSGSSCSRAALSSATRTFSWQIEDSMYCTHSASKEPISSCEDKRLHYILTHQR